MNERTTQTTDDEELEASLAYLRLVIARCEFETFGECRSFVQRHWPDDEPEQIEQTAQSIFKISRRMMN